MGVFLPLLSLLGLLRFCFSSREADLGSDLTDVWAELAALRAQGAETQRKLESLQALFEDCDCGVSSGLQKEEVEWEEEVIREGAEDDGGLLVDSSSVVAVDVRNEAWVKEVFFSGAPWIVFCLDRRSSVRQEVPEVFSEAAFKLRSVATFGTLPCWERLSSGKTLADRFRLPKPPVTFAVANGDAPLVLDLHDVVDAWQLKLKADMYLMVRVTEIEYLHDFRALCSTRRACLVVSFRVLEQRVAVGDTVVPLLAQHRAVRAVALDATVWKLRVEEQFLASRPVVGSERADLICLARTGGTSGVRHSGAFFQGDLFAPAAVGEFLDRCERSVGLVSLAKAPWITRRDSPAPSPPAPPAKAKEKRKAKTTRKARKQPKARRSRGKPVEDDFGYAFDL